MTIVYEADTLAAAKRIRKAKRWGKVLSVLTLGTFNNSAKVTEAQNYFDECKRQQLKYNLLREKADSLDAQFLETVLIEGIRVSKNTFSDFPVLGGANYPNNWEELRNIVLTRDNYQCQEKTAECSGPLQIHHILSLSKGGTNKEKNLITLCMYHHCLKHEHMRNRYANLWF